MVSKFTKLPIPEVAIRVLNFGCILMVLICFSMLPAMAEAIVISLVVIDSGLTTPPGNYRWVDVADQLYSEGYRNSYDYTQATVEVTYTTAGNTFQGTLSASNLKPNFAYQLKIEGASGSSSNLRIGLAGRWWQQEWNGSQWANGQNLNNRGGGTSPNPNDLIYFSRRDIVDPTSPSVLRYDYTAYLVFDCFITDENGNAFFSFETNSSYHVLWKTSQRARTDTDGPIKLFSFDADNSTASAYNDADNSTALAYDDTGGDDYIYRKEVSLVNGSAFL